MVYKEYEIFIKLCQLQWPSVKDRKADKKNKKMSVQSDKVIDIIHASLYERAYKKSLTH